MKVNDFLKIQHPVFTTVIPSTKEIFKYRPIVAKEEKILLIAKLSEDNGDIFNAIYQIVNNCAINPIDLSKLTVFDLEFLFLKIRAASVSEIIQQSYLDTSDNENYSFNIKVDDIKIINLENTDFKVLLSNNTGLVLKYPSADLYLDKNFFEAENNSDDILIYHCIDKFFTENEVKNISEFDKDAVVEWIETLDLKYRKILESFIDNLPKLYYEIKYQNKLGEDRVIKLTTLADFFTLR